MKKLTTLQKHGKTLISGVLLLITALQSGAQNTSQQGLEESLTANLYHLETNGTTRLVDGNLTNYDDVFTNGLADDAIKMNNFGENFGILRAGTRLAIEQRKKVNVKDTAFFCMWNMLQRQYRLIVSPKNLEHPGLLGSLEDAFTGSKTALFLNGDNTYDFNVTSDPASYALDRFRVVFRNRALMPTPTIGVFNVEITGASIHLQWVVEHESEIVDYNIEHSTDRNHFSSIQIVAPENAGGSKTYNATDLVTRKADNYYRIKATTLEGKIIYSSIQKVSIASPVSEMIVYPNPVADRKLNLILPAGAEGKYSLMLYTVNGNMIPLSSIQAGSGQSVQIINLPKTVAPGVYRLKIISPANTITVKTINVL